MIEILQWVLLNDLKTLTSTKLSNLLLVLYCLSYVNSKKGYYPVAFLFVEFYGASIISSQLTSTMYYAMYAAIYACCYWYEVFVGKNIKIMLAYGFMVLFQLTMASDAFFYPTVETYIYNSYEYVVVAIHLYIIICLIDWKLLQRTVGDYLKCIANFFDIGYALSFCYTVYILHNPKQKKW